MNVKWGGAMDGANRPDVSEKGRCDVEAESLVWCGRGTWTEGALPTSRGRERLA